MRRSDALLPFLFIALFGTGYPVAKLGFAYASPLAFLATRLAVAVVVLAAIALLARVPWPRGKALMHAVVAGLLTVGTFTIASWVAVGIGVSIGLCALVMALQPLLVAVAAAPLLGERLDRRTLIGLVVAFAGVAFVVAHAVVLRNAPVGGIALAFFSLVGLSGGTLYQKRFCAEMNPFSGGAVQTAASAVVAALVGELTEPMRIVWTLPFVLALAFLSIGVSVGAITILYVMLRKGTATRVASTFYLLPVASVLASFVLLHTPISPITLVGIAIVAAGVTIANVKPSLLRVSAAAVRAIPRSSVP
jgi:drug/metabolite transporter (DMT)-like permease